MAFRDPRGHLRLGTAHKYLISSRHSTRLKIHLDLPPRPPKRQVTVQLLRPGRARSNLKRGQSHSESRCGPALARTAPHQPPPQAGRSVSIA
jgi:hypothetical protein